MAVTCANLTSGVKTTDATSADTASISPSANKLILLAVESKTEITADPNQPTATGCGLTWVAVNTIVTDPTSSSRRRITLFRALGASPSAGAVTIDFGGQTQVTSAWVIDQCDGMDTSGTNGSGAVVQSATARRTDEEGAVASLTATLAAFGSTSNATYGMGGQGNGSTAVTAGSGFSIIGNATDSSENNIEVNTEFKNSNDTSVDFSYSPNDSGCGIIAIEIKAEVLVPDATSNSGVKSAVSTFNWSHTCATGSNRLLVVTVQSRDASTTADLPITGVTYNSVAMTKAVTQNYPNDAFLRTEIWYLVAPVTGANTVAVTYTGTIDTATGIAVSFTGANQSSVLGITGGAQADAISGTDPSVTVTTTAVNSYLVDSVYNKSGTNMTVGAGQTSIAQLSPNGGGDRSAASYKLFASIGSSTMTWTETVDDDWASCVAEFRDINFVAVRTLAALGVG